MTGMSDGVSDFFIMRSKCRGIGDGSTSTDLYGYKCPVKASISLVRHEAYRRSHQEQLDLLNKLREAVELEIGEIINEQQKEYEMIKIKKMNPNVITPDVVTDGSAGIDLRANIKSSLIIDDNPSMINTGLQIAIPPGYVGLIRPRSGLAVKKGIDVLAGVVDSDYRGQIKVVLVTCNGKAQTLDNGEKCAQLVIVPCITKFEMVDNLDDTERSDRGFGQVDEDHAGIDRAGL